MTDPITCLKCGAPLEGGSCPRCLLAAGLESGAPGASAPSAPSPADMQKHFPALEVLELLGQGGMGIVYKARQRNLDRFVALKVLLPEIAREPGFAERFTREARTLARLQHPHIVGVHDFGESDGLWFLVMEFVDGTNLRQVLKAGGLGPKEALAIVPQVCDALQYAHDQGIVHRDIKPENILVDRAGRVKIADFGLAKLLQRAPVELNITRTGQVMGTLHYMAPEQYRAPEGVDHRADIYSLGVVFYEMLTGDLPVGAFPRPSSRAGVDARLDGVVMRAMERERDQRYQKASEVRTAVDGIAAGGAAPAAAPAPAAPSAPTAMAEDPELNRWAFYGGLGVPAAIAAGFLGWLLVIPFASTHAAVWVGSFLATITALAGWISAFVGWAQVHHAPRRWKGLGWAITGAFLPLVLFCSGGFLVPLWVVASSPASSPIHISEGADGTSVRLPGISVEDGPDGTRVRLPGLSVEEKRDVSTGPGNGDNPLFRIEGGPPFVGSSEKLAILKGLDRSWDDLVEVWPGIGGGGARIDALFVKEDRETLERMTPAEATRDGMARRLGAPRLLAGDFQGSDPREMRLVRVILAETGTEARVVRSDGRLVLSYPAAADSGRWRFRIGEVGRTFVSGGPATATPKWRADAVRGLERLWISSGEALLKEHFPGTDLADRAGMFRLHSLALRTNSTIGRMVWSDGGTTISLPCRYVDGKWEIRHQAVQRVDRAPEFDDRDGWLGKEPEPADLSEIGGNSPGSITPKPVEEGEASLARKVTGGQPDMTDADRAALARKLDLLWKSGDGAAFIAKYRYMFAEERKAYAEALAAPVEKLALFAVRLDGAGVRARVVRSNGRMTVAFPVALAENWSLVDGDVEFQERAATEADRDGWLLR